MRIVVTVPKEGTFEHSFDKETITVGRSKKNDLSLPYTGVSSTHISITDKSGDLYITDLNSTNGVFVDDIPIEAGIQFSILPFQRVFLGELIEIAIEPTSVISDDKSVPNQRIPRKVSNNTESINLGSMKAATKIKKNNFKIEPKPLALIMAGALLFWVLNQEESPENAPKKQEAKIKTFVKEEKSKKLDYKSDIADSIKEATIVTETKGCISDEEKIMCKYLSSLLGDGVNVIYNKKSLEISIPLSQYIDKYKFIKRISNKELYFLSTAKFLFNEKLLDFYDKFPGLYNIKIIGMVKYGLTNKSKLYIQTNKTLIEKFDASKLNFSVDSYIKNADSSLFDKNVKPYFDTVEYF